MTLSAHAFDPHTSAHAWFSPSLTAAMLRLRVQAAHLCSLSMTEAVAGGGGGVGLGEALLALGPATDIRASFWCWACLPWALMSRTPLFFS